MKSNDELDAEIIRREQDEERENDGTVINIMGQISPEFSDDSLALQFAAEYERDFRYVAAFGKWYQWDGFRWQTDETLNARNTIRQVCRRESSRCNKTGTAKQVASAKTASAVERLAQCDRRFAATVDQWDADPWLLNTPAGIVDLRTGEIRKHDRHAYITKITGAAPDAKCPTPNWHAFLNRVTDNDQELIEYLQRMAGYSLTGLTSEHAMFFIYGLGANGKTTFLNALTKAAGDYHSVAPIETFTASNSERHPTELAGLQGARLVTAVETEEGRRWAESRVKALTGGDKIAARFMRQDFFHYTPQFKLIIAGNHKPGLRSVDEAIRRRFNLIPFTVTIPPEERDENLPAKLDAELPGILQWMIDSCLAWQKRGLSPPQAVTEATAQYLESEDTVTAWIEECSKRDPNAWEKTTALFGSWTQWATRAGEQIGTQKSFGQRLESKGIDFQRKIHGRGYRGLRLLPTGYDG
jgi:putative DNA primase/helicase